MHLRRPAFLLLGFLLAMIAAPAHSATRDDVRAQLVPRRYAVVAAEVAAKVSRVHTPEGARFATGDVLISFDSTLQRAQLERAEAVLAAAEKTAAAHQRLVELQSVGQIEAALSEADVRKARAEVAYARTMLERCEIRAPYAGRIAEQRVREEEFVQPGQAVLEIIDDAVPEVNFIAPSKWLAWLRVGQEIAVRIEETDRTYTARIERIGAKVDAVSQSVKIVAALVGEHPELIAGMSGTVSVSAPSSP